MIWEKKYLPQFDRSVADISHETDVTRQLMNDSIPQRIFFYNKNYSGDQVRQKVIHNQVMSSSLIINCTSSSVTEEERQNVLGSWKSQISFCKSWIGPKYLASAGFVCRKQSYSYS